MAYYAGLTPSGTGNYYNARWRDPYGTYHIERYWSTHRAGSRANLDDCRHHLFVTTTPAYYMEHQYRIGNPDYEFEVRRVPNPLKDGGNEVFYR